MVKDSDIYAGSKDFLEQHFSDIYNMSEDYIIISISRKGPKLLELLFGKNNRNNINKDNNLETKINTITEVALPFYFMRLTPEKLPSRAVIFDDAIYFGTTVEGIYREFVSFERLYGINTKKELYTAIRSREAKNNLDLDNTEIHSYNEDNKIDLRLGYGHYFIKRLEEDFTILNNTLEVEFPIVEFIADVPIDKALLFKTIKDYYGKDIAFDIYHSGQSSVSVVLDDKAVTKGQSFRKFRIYVDDKIIRVVCMAPWILPNDIAIISRLFETSKFSQIWQQLIRAYTYPLEEQKNVKANYFLNIERCIRKSLIIVANYILSFNLLLEEQIALCDIFNSVSSSIRYKGIDIRDLFYLLGDLEKCDAISKVFDNLWGKSYEKQKEVLMPNIKPSESLLDYQVFENENFPEKDELIIFQKHNQEMLANSLNIYESLSAMFFNQTALIEKWSRRNDKYDFGRLRFGYTYHSLYRDLIGAGKMEPTIIDRRKVNQWMDCRIDQACVVPQYIIDKSTNQWCRVFRPGENEDALLNHLARYVLAVFKIINSIQGLGWVYEHYLREMLCLSVMSTNFKCLKKSFEFELIADIDNRTLLFKYDGQEQSRDVLNYMIDMKILKLENGMVSISEELIDDEIGKATTLDKDILSDVRFRLTEVAKMVENYKYQNYTFFVTNFFFFQKAEINDLKHLNCFLKESLIGIIGKIEETEDAHTHQQLFQNYYKTKKYIVSINILKDEQLLSSLLSEEAERKEYICEMIILWMIKSICELLIVTFLRDKVDDLNNEVNSSLTSPLVYGYSLSLSFEEAKQIKSIIEKSADMKNVREIVLEISKRHLDDISKVTV